jgi:DNA polymerase III delta subunit
LAIPKVAGCKCYILAVVGREWKNTMPEALDKFLQKTGNGLAVVDGEFAKLLLYVGGRETVTTQDVDSIIVNSRACDFFEVINLFLCRKF